MWQSSESSPENPMACLQYWDKLSECFLWAKKGPDGGRTQPGGTLGSVVIWIMAPKVSTSQSLETININFNGKRTLQKWWKEESWDGVSLLDFLGGHEM